MAVRCRPTTGGLWEWAGPGPWGEDPSAAGRCRHAGRCRLVGRCHPSGRCRRRLVSGWMTGGRSCCRQTGRGAGRWSSAPRSPRSAGSRTSSCSCRRRAWRGSAGGAGSRPGRPSTCCTTCPGERCRWRPLCTELKMAENYGWGTFFVPFEHVSLLKRLLYFL